MKTLSRFITKFTNLIVAVLSCYDRVIFKGYLFISNPQRSKVSSTKSCKSVCVISWPLLRNSRRSWFTRQTLGRGVRRRIPVSFKALIASRPCQ